ncbi:MAG: hypothetical protein ACREBE_07870 [bacterium]
MVIVIKDWLAQYRRLEKTTTRGKPPNASASAVTFDVIEPAELLDVIRTEERSPCGTTNYLAPARLPVHPVEEPAALLGRQVREPDGPRGRRRVLGGFAPQDDTGFHSDSIGKRDDRIKCVLQAKRLESSRTERRVHPIPPASAIRLTELRNGGCICEDEQEVRVGSLGRGLDRDRAHVGRAHDAHQLCEVVRLAWWHPLTIHSIHPLHQSAIRRCGTRDRFEEIA